ncbi:MAG: hypothetical protein OHK0032_09650 [Thermodesulfovibrionales bacterium]
MLRLGIKIKLIILVLTVALPLFGFHLYHVFRDLRQARGEARRWSLHQAHMVSSEVDAFLHGGRQILTALSEIPEVKNQEWGKCIAILSRLNPQYPHYENLFVIEGTGYVRCSAVPQDRPVNVQDRSYFKEVMGTGMFTVGEVQIGRITKKPVVVLAYPLMDSSGRQTGIVGASISLLRVQDIFRHLGQMGDTTITIADRKGRIIASTVKPETTVMKDVSGEAWFKEVTQKGSGIFEMWHFGAERLIAVASPSIVNWYVVVGIPVEDIYSPIRKEILRGVFFSLLTLFSALALSWLLGRRIVSPLMRLAAEARETGKGRFGKMVEVKTGDEIEDLAKGFNQMSAEIKVREDALMASEERFRSLVQSATDGIISADSRGNIISSNRGAQKIFGYTEQEVHGESLTILMPERYREAHKKGLERVNSTGESRMNGKTIETYGLRKDGSEFPLELSISFWNAGGETFFTGIVRDITDRKLMEETMRESEKRYRHLVESVTDYIYTVMVEDGMAVSTSHGPGCVAVTGYTPEELDADPHLWYRMVHEEDRGAVVEQTNRVLTGKAVRPLEHRIIHKDGQMRWVRNTVVPRYDEHGRLIAYDGLIKDITEIKRLEDQFRQAQKMEAIGQLASGIAHDFNNILNAIIGFGSLMEMKMGDNDPNRAYLKEIIKAGERATHLTRGLLAYSRKQIIDLRPENLNEIIRDFERFLRRIIGEDIGLKTILSDKNLIVMADSSQMQQVIMNLATNARDAMPDGGELVIETGISEMDEDYVKRHGYGEPGMYALMSVTDTGIGMDEKTRERIFEPFFTTKEMGRGTGLGLSIVYGIIKQHGGFINVYSEPGRGTTFKVYLPLVKPGIEEGLTVQEFTPYPEGGTETVLVAEDDEAVRKLITDILVESGYKVIVAEDGEEAVKRFKENEGEIKLLLLDVIMSRKSGMEAYGEIRDVKPGIKAVFLSGYTADLIHKKRMLDEGVDFLPKPVTPRELLKKVREVLDSPHSSSP